MDHRRSFVALRIWPLKVSLVGEARIIGRDDTKCPRCFPFGVKSHGSRSIYKPSDKKSLTLEKAIPVFANTVPTFSFSSLLKNLEIGASPVFLPWGLGRSGCCEQTLTYAASSLGMRIRL